MNCDQFLRDLSEYIDGELDLAPAEAQRLHAQECERCRVLLATTRQMLRIVGDERSFAMPAGVSQRLRQALEAGLGEPLIPTVLRPTAVHPAAPRPPSRFALAWNSRLLSAAAVLLAVIFGGFGLLRWRASATTTSGWLMDRHCFAAFQTHPADHTRACLLKCGVGYGLVDAQGHFLAFDPKGNSSAVAALRATTKPDHLWVTVHARETSQQVLEVKDLEITDPAAGTSARSESAAETAALFR